MTLNYLAIVIFMLKYNLQNYHYSFLARQRSTASGQPLHGCIYDESLVVVVG